MMGDVLLRICGRRRFMPRTGVASNFVVFSSKRRGISARMPTMTRAGAAALAEASPWPAFRHQRLHGKTEAAVRGVFHRTI
jgi:hypothetical protein